jgi:hypothetical protein
MKNKIYFILSAMLVIAFANLRTADAGAPYKAHVTPGIIQAEDFDLGGEGLGFHKASEEASDGVEYRTDAESAPVKILEGPATGNYNVTSLLEDEWLAYTFEVPAEAAGTYDLIVHGSSDYTGTAHIQLDGEPWGTGVYFLGEQAPGRYQIFGTGGLELFGQTIFQGLELTAGTHVFKITAGSTLGFDKFEFVKIPSTPYTDENITGLQVVPGILETEYFDNGGPSVAYWVADPSLGGENNSIRKTEGVPIGYDEEYGYTYITLKNLEWAKYTVAIEAHATYDLNFEAFTTAAGTVLLYIDNEIIGTTTVTASEDWSYPIMPTVELGDGEHVLRLVYKGEGEIKISNIFIVEHVVPQPRYVYDFEDASDLQKATIGDTPLVFYNKGDGGSDEDRVGEPDITLITQIDGPTPGNKAIAVPLAAKIKVVLNNSDEILPTEQRTDRFTMLWDIKRPETTVGKYSCLFQNIELNNSDGALFINSRTMSANGTYAGIGLANNNKYYGADVFTEGDEPWYRIIFVSNGDSHRIFINGTERLAQSTSSADRFKLGNYFWLFGDENGESHEIYCSKFAYWDEAVGLKDLEDTGFGGTAFTAIKKVEPTTGKVYAENGKLHVEGYSASASVEVYNLVGQKVIAAKSLNGKTVNVSKGLYLVKVTDKGNSDSYKILSK